MAVLIETADDTTTVRKLVLDPSSGFTASGGWKRSDETSDWTRPRLQSDADGAVYIPLNNATEPQSIAKISSTGVTEWLLEITDPIGNRGVKSDASFPDGPSIGYETFAVAFSEATPVYSGQITTLQPEFIYVMGDPGIVNRPAVFKVELVTRTLNPGSTRSETIVAIADSSVRTVDPSQTTGSQVVTVSGGSMVLDAAAQFIALQPFFGDMFIIDGQNNFVYRPTDDVVVPWVAETAGSIPSGCRLMTSWNASIVLARPSGSPQQWFISATADGYNWDTSPAVLSATQAISGTDSRAGECPDVINALVDWSDDLLLFGCDSSIQRLTGDPRRDGRFDLVTDKTGMAFGTSWTKDDREVVYFLGAQMNIWALEPGFRLRNISRGRIEDLLRSIDLSVYQPRFSWNPEDNTVHVFFAEIPDAAGDLTGATPRSFVYERDVDAWHVDAFASANHQVQNAATIDGDQEGDRALLVCSADGFVRKWDRSATSDDGTAIAAHALIGPLRPRRLTGRVRWDRPSVTLSDDSAAATVQLFASDNPANAGLAVGSAALSSGYNDRLAIRGKGRYGWMRLSSAAGRFSLDSASIEPAFAGR